MFVKMSMPVFYKCSPCKYHYDAVIDMDFFDEHSRFDENVIWMDLKKMKIKFQNYPRGRGCWWLGLRLSF